MCVSGDVAVRVGGAVVWGALHTIHKHKLTNTIIHKLTT